MLSKNAASLACYAGGASFPPDASARKPPHRPTQPVRGAPLPSHRCGAAKCGQHCTGVVPHPDFIPADEPVLAELRAVDNYPVLSKECVRCQRHRPQSSLDAAPNLVPPASGPYPKLKEIMDGAANAEAPSTSKTARDERSRVPITPPKTPRPGNAAGRHLYKCPASMICAICRRPSALGKTVLTPHAAPGDSCS